MPYNPQQIAQMLMKRQQQAAGVSAPDTGAQANASNNYNGLFDSPLFNGYANSNIPQPKTPSQTLTSNELFKGQLLGSLGFPVTGYQIASGQPATWKTFLAPLGDPLGIFGKSSGPKYTEFNGPTLGTSADQAAWKKAVGG